MLNTFQDAVQLQTGSNQAPAMIHHMMIIKPGERCPSDGLQRLPG
jgi:hypothetical protein